MKKIFFGILSLFGVIMSMPSFANTTSATIGFAQKGFPKDPIAINQFNDHMLVGQIIEPLVDVDRNGELAGGIAESWVFNQSKKEILFKLKTGIFFSNGKELRATDVAYSLKRHLNSTSQSSAFLADIDEISIVGKNDVLIKLRNPNPAIIKVLSRDQLGIVPENWHFDPTSTEPIVGTGPYRLVADGKSWNFVLNSRYHQKLQSPVTSWRIVFFEDLEGVQRLPDYMVSISPSVLKSVLKMKKYSSSEFQQRVGFGFGQTSFWIYSTSKLYSDDKLRARVGSALNAAVSLYCEKNSYIRAHGLIPNGVPGHLPESVPLVDVLPDASEKIVEVRMASLANVMDDFDADKDVIEIFRKFRISLKIEKFTPNDLQKMPERKIDIITGAWAGGFNDPTGFMGLIKPMLGIPFEQYLGKSSVVLKNARLEQDWGKRSQMFREFDRALVTSRLLVPGWRMPASSLLRKGLQFADVQNRYTERLVNVQKAN